MTSTAQGAMEPAPQASMPVAGMASGDTRTLPRTDVPSDFKDMLEMAKELSEASDFLPAKLRGSPGNILAMMLQARALDIPLAVAWNEIYSPSSRGGVGKSAKLQRALARRAGHRLAYVSYDKNQAVLLIQLKGESEPRRVQYTIQDASRMGYLDEGYSNHRNWLRQPERMLVARVTTRAIDMYCPEVALGMAPEDELDDGFEITSDVVTAYDAEDKERVKKILRTAETIDCMGDGAKRLQALRDLWVESADYLGFSADDTGEYAVRQVLMEKMKEADGVAKRQAAGEPVPQGDDEKPKRKRAPRKTAAKKTTTGAAKKAAPRKAAAKKTAPAPKAEPESETLAADADEDVSAEGERGDMPCGCTVQDMVFGGGHTCGKEGDNG